MKKEQKKRRKKQQKAENDRTTKKENHSRDKTKKYAKHMYHMSRTPAAHWSRTPTHIHTSIPTLSLNDTRAPHRIYHHIQHKHVLRVGSPFGNSDGPQTDTTTKRQHTHNRPCVRYVFIFFLGRSTWLYFSTGISPAIYYCVKEILVSSAKVPTAIRQPRPTDQPSNQASNQPTEAKTNKN